MSLFTGAGIGDLGFRAAGTTLLAGCEFDPSRAALAGLNFPEARLFRGDVWEEADALVAWTRSRLRAERQGLYLLTCTAPCQGMSKNGQGTLLGRIRKGERPELDPRNRLFLPALDVVDALRPLWVVFENVAEMRNTVVEDGGGRLRSILDVIDSRLSPTYVGRAHVVEFADHGIPQRRRRLITVYTRSDAARRMLDDGASLLPAETHAKDGSAGRDMWVSVAEALEDFPALDARDTESATCAGVPFHRVPVLDAKKYEWVRHTPRGASAFDNQCTACCHDANPTHGARLDRHGVNRAREDTPLHCEACGALLPRPYTEVEDGTKRIMRGYTSAYKRMRPDLPAPALTRNLSYACSDQKVHPTQNRVLSLAEAMRLQTLDLYDYRWGPLTYGTGKRLKTVDVAPDSLIRLVVGESVPPLFLERLARHIEALTLGETPAPAKAPRRRRGLRCA